MAFDRIDRQILSLLQEDGRMTNVDLAERLDGRGFSTWCSGSVEFWILDEPPLAAGAPQSAVVRRIDAALLELRERSGGRPS